MATVEVALSESLGKARIASLHMSKDGRGGQGMKQTQFGNEFLCTSVPPPFKLTAEMKRTLRSICKDDIVVIFSPISSKLKEKKETSLTADPFEVFGQSIGKGISRVRHVPYSPSIGVTKAQSELLSRANAVIVISREVGDVDKLSSSTGKEADEELVGQLKFANHVRLLCINLSTVGAEQKGMPMVQVMIGNSEELPKPGLVFHDRNVVRARSSEEQELEKMAKLLCKGMGVKKRAGTTSKDKAQTLATLEERMDSMLRQAQGPGAGGVSELS